MSPHCRGQSPHPLQPFPAAVHIHHPLLLCRSTAPHSLANWHQEQIPRFSPDNTELKIKCITKHC